MKTSLSFILAAATITAIPTSWAKPALTPPPETARFAPGPGSEIANSQCLICHSADYVSTQPRTLTRTQWSNIIRKMKDKLGAPIADEHIEPLVDYLIRNYGKPAEH